MKLEALLNSAFFVVMLLFCASIETPITQSLKTQANFLLSHLHVTLKPTPVWLSSSPFTQMLLVNVTNGLPPANPYSNIPTITGFVSWEYFTQFNTVTEFCDAVFSMVSSTVLAPFTGLLCQFILYLMSQFQVSQAPVFHDFLSLYSLCMWFIIHFYIALNSIHRIKCTFTSAGYKLLKDRRIKWTVAFLVSTVPYLFQSPESTYHSSAVSQVTGRNSNLVGSTKYSRERN